MTAHAPRLAPALVLDLDIPIDRDEAPTVARPQQPRVWAKAPPRAVGELCKCSDCQDATARIIANAGRGLP